MKNKEFNDTKQKLYDVVEVSTILRISYIQCLKLIRAGKIKAIKVGANYRITEEELQRILREGTK